MIFDIFLNVWNNVFVHTGADAGGERTSILPPTEHKVPLLGFPG